MTWQRAIYSSPTERSNYTCKFIKWRRARESPVILINAMPKIVYSSFSDRKIALAFYVYIYLYIAFWYYFCSVYLHVHNHARDDLVDRGGFHWLVWVKFSPAFERFEASINNRERQEEQHSLAHNRIIKLSTLIRDSSLEGRFHPDAQSKSLPS